MSDDYPNEDGPSVIEVLFHGETLVHLDYDERMARLLQSIEKKANEESEDEHLMEVVLY